HKEIAGNIIGFASFNDKGGISRFEGKDGLELELEKYLSPNPVDPAKTKQDNGKVNLVTDIPKGNDVCLTIDMEIQTCLEKELDKRIEECYAEDGMGVVLDPHTGAILAIASRPSYDPNLLIASRQDAFKNKVISECFEPGSTFKIVTASAGLEQGKVDLYTSIDCEGGRLKVGKKVIRDVHAMYVSSFWECFEQSSNVAFVKVGMLVGLDSLKDYIRKFGFGQKASDDFQNERMGAISTNTALTTLSSMSIGYAVAVTTLQLARAYAVIANGGYLVDAYIVDKVVSELEEASGDGLDSAINELNQGSNDESEKLDGILKDKSDNQPKEFKVVYRHEVKRERVISEETAEKMKMLCHQVILKGTGKSALIPEYKAGGKTGTAHLAKPADLGGGYDPNRIISLFAGFAPLKNPRIVVVIVIRYPQSKIRFGGYVCGPVFKNVVYHTLTYLNVPPEPLDMKEVKRDGFLAQESYNDDNDTINLAELEPIIPGEISDKKTANAGESENRPLERTQLTDKDGLSGNRFGDKNSELEILGLFNPKDIEYIVARSKLERSMPNLIGLTKLQAMEILEGLGLGYECNGYGRVVEQYPLPGDSIEGVDVCVIELSNDISNLSMNN
ncbi:MAG: transpeptidase family protein, partial [Candidatus Hydrogenedentes bacterium]|nr:transpeptidase family protein [Candidatus Hydrogenedentota bacterium]